MKYIDDVSDSDYRHIKELSDEGKFNNSFIEKIVQDSELGPLFNRFLRREANMWI